MRGVKAFLGVLLVVTFIICAVTDTFAASAKCTPPGSCGGYTQCMNSDSCYCGTTAVAGKGFCFEDQACNAVVACTNSIECVQSLGLNYRCIKDTCCGAAGICLPKCGTASSTDSEDAELDGPSAAGN